MASYEGVKVEIISKDEVLPTFNDPDVAEVDLVPTPQYYIEATTGATFSVRVTLALTFERGPCDAVRVFVNYDGDRRSYYHDLLKESVGPLLREAHFTEISSLDSMTGQWVRGKPAFAKMDTSKAQSFGRRFSIKLKPT